ncbi:hypothetical protein VC_2155 [Vibrio cholerae O1 biovar El Tor str. N16961]|uniref:RfbP protein n=2 Tax=Vibrio cholerae TaxID=666 RepID=Q9KQ49_VIBCH|nr:hypothetical protein VC_2155 [Vibrio cholerae O1 biovar El Tor str. N16961]ACP06380.1 conserved hypothetical protein [Vibrio cholerae M66-2]CSI42164.1 Uncharacterised protein [Vibrio cholerae]
MPRHPFVFVVIPKPPFLAVVIVLRFVVTRYL